jgi:ATP-binding cassette subfamily B protein
MLKALARAVERFRGAARTWGERATILRHLPPFLRMAWDAQPRYVSSIVALRLLQAVFPLLTLWIGKLIVDTVVAAIRTGVPDWNRIALLVLSELLIVSMGGLAGRATILLELLLGDLLTHRISLRLMQHAATLDLQQFEDPNFADQMQRARDQTARSVGILNRLSMVAQDILTLAGLAAALLAYSPLLFALLLLTVVPSFVSETYFASMRYSMLYDWTPERRKLDYYRWLAASPHSVKEVKLLGLSEYLISEYRGSAERFFQIGRSLSIRQNLSAAALSLLSSFGYYAAYATILVRTVQRVLTLGDLVMLSSTFARSRDTVMKVLGATANLYENALYLNDLFAFLSIRPTLTDSPNAIPVPRTFTEGFEFRDVWFRYPRPGAADAAAAAAGQGAGYGEHDSGWILQGVSFTIRPGERWALVGENGAGKSTLVKLLLRLYEPSLGEIYLDGLPLAAYDRDDYYRRVGAIFQDFVRYDMTAAENVAMGKVSLLRGAPADASPQIVSAAERSLAAGVIEALPRRYETMLGRRFEGGVDLSGGEWQKVALARAYMREAQVLILDEPTAALDARGEYEVFRRFAKLTEGRTAIFISHRFSTVRIADRILVLSRGQIVEEGSHEELVAAGGQYAELFELQAEGYR